MISKDKGKRIKDKTGYLFVSIIPVFHYSFEK